MNDILANPIWFALDSENEALGKGNDDAKRFDPQVAPFAGLKDYNPDNFDKLAELVAQDQVVVLFYPEAQLDILPFELVVKVPGFQMVFEGDARDLKISDRLTKLNTADVSQMLTLTGLAQPGPFSEQTISFGGYLGVFLDDKLVAMGGMRLQAEGFTEISAVCTHPDHSGKGYAREVINALIVGITAEGKIPYLHVRADNTRAVELYLKMGFAIRREMYFYVIKRTDY